MLSFSWMPRKKRIDPTAELIAEFLRQPEHQWIGTYSVLLERIAGFLCTIPHNDLQVILKKRGLLLLYCNPKMSCAFHQFQRREIVLMFPDLIRLLQSPAFHQGYAILAHELGHVYHAHSSRIVNPLRAQIEADAYAATLGLAEELFDVLRLESPSSEIRERLAVLRRAFNAA